MSPSQYLHFIFKFANATAGSSEFLRLLCRHAGDISPVDAVLFEPVVDRRLRDVEVVGGPRDRPRETLGYLTPLEKFTERVALTG